MRIPFTSSGMAVHRCPAIWKQPSDTTAITLIFLALTWAWVMAVGCDLSWDVMNHHVYLPFSLLSGRFRHDLLAAGPQSYQNPLGYVPFYLLLQARLPAWVIGTALALLHALAVVPLASICRSLWGGESSARLWRWLAVAMAWASPVFLLTVGTSSIDPVGQLLVLTALATVLQPAPRNSSLLLAASGLGLAVAIKPTAVFFALPMGVVLLLRLATRQVRWQQALLFGAATCVATTVLWGPWAWWLWTEFHNPLFPLFNDVFRSPFVWAQAVVDRRFLPDGLDQWLLRPWQLAEMRRFATTEAFIPDLRPLALSMFAIAALPLALLRARRQRMQSQPASIEIGPTTQLAVFIALSFILWMTLSGNTRYAMPLMAVVGILLVRTVQWLLPQRMARAAALLLLSLQLLNYGLQGEHRLWPRPWTSGPYIDVQVPERLRQQPFLHLTLGLQTHAAIAPWLHRDGAMINAVGQMTIPSDGPLRAAFDARVRAWQGRVRFLFLSDGRPVSSPPPLLVRRADRVTYHLGLRVDWSDCERILLLRGKGMVGDDESGAQTLLSCKAGPRPDDDPGFFAARDRVDRAFTAIEQRCPKIYAPAPLVTDAGLDEWQRRYANTDIRVTIDATDAVVVTHHRSTSIIRLGTVDEVVAGRGQDPCTAWKQLLTQP